MASFTHVAQAVQPQYGRVKFIKIRVCVNDCSGSIATGCIAHVSEIQWMEDG